MIQQVTVHQLVITDWMKSTGHDVATTEMDVGCYQFHSESLSRRISLSSSPILQVAAFHHPTTPTEDVLSDVNWPVVSETRNVNPRRINCACQKFKTHCYLVMCFYKSEASKEIYDHLRSCCAKNDSFCTHHSRILLWSLMDVTHFSCKFSQFRPQSRVLTVRRCPTAVRNSRERVCENPSLIVYFDIRKRISLTMIIVSNAN